MNYIPHPHPLHNTIYVLSSENIDDASVDGISIFVSLNSPPLWQPTQQRENNGKLENRKCCAICFATNRLLHFSDWENGVDVGLRSINL